MWQSHLCKLPILQEKGDLVDDVQRNASLPTLPSRGPLEDTLSSSDQASSHFSHTGFFGSPFSIHHPNQGRDILTVSSFFRNRVQGDKRALFEELSGEEGNADVSIDERAEGPTVRRNRRLLFKSKRKRARRVARTSLAHSTKQAFPTNFGGSQRQPLQDTPSTNHSAETSKTIFPHISGLCPAPHLGL